MSQNVENRLKPFNQWAKWSIIAQWKMTEHMYDPSISATNSNSSICTTDYVCVLIVDLNSDGSRRVSVQMTSSLKGNFVVSQSDLWDTHTLSHAKQHQRQSPRSHQGSSRCPDHGHLNQTPQQPQQQQQQRMERLLKYTIYTVRNGFYSRRN